MLQQNTARGCKIKYEPVQFEGLSDAKMVHSGLLPPQLSTVGKILQREKIITAARTVSCVFTPASMSTALHTTI